MAGHVPHHATIAQTEQYLLAWGSTLAKARVRAGIDANEVLTDPDSQGPRAHTGLGEAVLATMQDLATPTYHPYNTQRPEDYTTCSTVGSG